MTSSVRNGQDDALQEPDGNEPVLAVVEPVVPDGHRFPGKQRLEVREIDVVVLKV